MRVKGERNVHTYIEIELRPDKIEVGGGGGGGGAPAIQEHPRNWHKHETGLAQTRMGALEICVYKFLAGESTW